MLTDSTAQTIADLAAKIPERGAAALPASVVEPKLLETTEQHVKRLLEIAEHSLNDAEHSLNDLEQHERHEILPLSAVVEARARRWTRIAESLKDRSDVAFREAERVQQLADDLVTVAKRLAALRNVSE